MITPTIISREEAKAMPRSRDAAMARQLAR